MKVTPEKFFPPDVDRREEQFKHLGRAVFRAEPEKVKARLKAKEEARKKANGAKPRKRGRPKRTA